MEAVPSWLAKMCAHVYVAVPKGLGTSGKEVMRRRICQACQTSSVAEARYCHECGIHADSPRSLVVSTDAPVAYRLPGISRT
jgi:hypothetical protein